MNSAARLEMPQFPKERFIDAITKLVAANADFVPPYGSGATLYIRPYMFGTNPVIGVKPASEYQFRASVHRSARTSRAALSRSQSVSQTSTAQHLTEQVM